MPEQAPFFEYPDTAADDLKRLHAAGAHLLCCSPIANGPKGDPATKTPSAKACRTPGWQKKPAAERAVLAALKARKLVGIVPASVGCTVVDVDGTPEEQTSGVEFLREKLGEPIVSHHTWKDGGRHLWFRAPEGEPVTNAKWFGPDGAHGELRGTCGYVVCWQPAAAAEAADGVEAAAPLGRAALEAICEKQPDQKTIPPKKPGEAEKAPKKRASPRRDLSPEALAAAPHGQRNDLLFDCAADAYYRLDGAELDDALDRLRTVALTFEGHNEKRISDTFASAEKSRRAQAGRAKRPKRKTAAKKKPPDSDAAGDGDERVLSEETLGREYLRQQGEDILHVSETGDWKRWTGKEWCAVHKLVVLSELMALGHEKWERKTSKEGWTAAPQIGGRKNAALGAQVTVAASTLTKNGDWDAQPDQIGLPEGRLLEVVDGALVERDRTRADRVSRSLAVRPAPRSKWENGAWTEHLLTVFRGDTDVAPALQVLLGQALLGRGQEDVVTMFVGTAQTGKTTTANAIRNAFGSYGGAPDVDSITSTRGMQIHSQRRLPYLGLRFALVSEPEENAQLDSSFIKRLSGGGEIRARGMRQDDSVFHFRGLLAIETNFEPGTLSPDPGLRRRMRVIRFRNRLDDDQIIGSYRDNLPLDEVAGWIVEGAAYYLEHGLAKMPESVMKASREWSEQADHLSAFVSEICELVPNAATPIAALFEAYETWIETEKATRYALSKRRFVKKVLEGFPGLERVNMTDNVKGVGGIRFAEP